MPNDEDLMRAYYASDDTAIEALYRCYRARLFFFFYRRGQSEQEADDRVNDVFVRVMETKYPPPGRSPSHYDPSTGVPFRAWLFQIALNLLRDMWRKSGRLVDFSERPGAEAEGEVVAFETTIPGKELPPEAYALAKERRDQVHECLATLPERERVVMSLWLELHGEATLADFAAILPASIATAWRVLKNALRLMRECLESKGVTDSDRS